MGGKLVAQFLKFSPQVAVIIDFNTCNNDAPDLLPSAGRLGVLTNSQLLTNNLLRVHHRELINLGPALGVVRAAS